MPVDVSFIYIPRDIIYTPRFFFTIVMATVKVTTQFRVSLESSIMPLVVSFTLLEAYYNCQGN